MSQIFTSNMDKKKPAKAGFNFSDEKIISQPKCKYRQQYKQLLGHQLLIC
jgi:hypothetical protein